MGGVARFCAGVAVAACACVLAPVALGTGAVTVTPAPGTVQPGSTATITAGMPVSDAGTVSQEIVQTIDPTKAVLTGSAGISRPVGWSLQYFSGSGWSATAPANAAAWAQVSKVKTSGTINSQGSESGYQIAVGTATGAAVNLTPPTIAASGSGDGYQAFFDPGRTRVFNVYHHQESGGQLDCHLLSTGSVCAGFPLNIMRMTSQYSTGRVVGTKIWIPGLKRIAVDSDDTAGFYCVDISAVLASGGNPSMCSTPYVPLAGTGYSALEVGTGTDYRLREFYAFDGVSTAGSEAEARLWAQVVRSGNLVCLDTATAAPCAGMPTNGWPTAVKGWKLDSEGYGGRRSSVVVSGGRIYTIGSTQNGNTTAGTLVLACNLVSNPATECPGFSGGKNLGGILGSGFYGTYRPMIGGLVELPTSSGAASGVCILGDHRLVPNYSGSVITRPQSSTAAVPCWDAAGASFSGPASLSTMVTSSFVYGKNDYQWPIRAGSRIYWANGVNWTTGGVEYPARVHCWDASASSGAGGPCANVPADGVVMDNYSVTPDPAIPDCMWITRHDQPNLVTYNMVGNVTSCSTIAPTRASFPGTTVVPRMACSASPGAVRAWRSFTLTSPAPSAGFSAVLTVKDSNGMPIPGWTNRPITAGTAFDLSSLSPATTGVSPSFDVDFTITSGSVSSATAEVRAVGDSPELCLTVEAKVDCPVFAGVGPIPTPANATSMALLGEGSATSASSTTTLTPGTGTLSIAAPSVAQCSGSLNGQAVDTSPTPRPAVGVTVELLDSTGAVVTYPTGHAQAGQAVTTTTDASGNYTFAGLAPASYKVRFSDAATATVVSSTVAAGGSGTTTAASGAVVSNASVVTAGGTGTVNAVYTLAPVAPSRAASTALNTAVTFDPFSASGSSAAATPSTGSNFTTTKGSTRLCGGSDTAPNCTQTTVTTAEGTWSVATAAGANQGKITFTPATGYTGAAPAMTYSVTDAAGRKASGALTPTVVGVPTAANDTSSGAWDANQTISVLANDAAQTGATLTASTVKLCPHPQPSAPYTAGNCNQATVSIANEGTYTANADGTVTFDPLPGFSGTVLTPVRYVVQDSLSQIASALITPSVATPDPPAASPESKQVAPGQTATFSNLITGAGALGSGSGLQTGNTNGPCLIDPADSTCKATFSIAGEGTWTVNRTTGVATFAASGSATAGTKTPVTYRVTDALGRTASSTLTPIVPPPPAATNDVSSGAWDANQTISVLANDSAGTGGSLVATSVKLCPHPQPSAPYTAGNCNQATVSIANEGTYTANADGTVTFDPLPGFSGTVLTPVRYVVQDGAGQVASALITPSVATPDPPAASPESKQVAPGQTATFSNLITGAGALGSGSGLQTGNTNGPCLIDPADSTCKATFSIAGEGTWTVNRTTGVATFAASGSATAGTKTPVTYRVTDALGRTASSTLTPIVPPPPAAADDSSLGLRDTDQTIRVLGNDTAGALTTLAVASVRLCTSATAASACSGSTLTISGEGTYTANADGTVTFDPDPAFTGTATPVRYVVDDGAAQRTTALITPVVVAAGPPAVAPATVAVDAGQSGTLAPAVTPGTAALDPARACLAAPGAASCTAGTTTLTRPEGTYVLDPATNAVTFTPAAGYAGTPTSPPSLCVTDVLGQSACGLLTPTVRPAPAPSERAPEPVGARPIALPDYATTQTGTPVTVALLANDAPGTGATLVASTVRLQDPRTGEWATRVRVPGEGVYVVDPATGAVAFTPAVGFSGRATPLAYRVADSAGRTAASTVQITVSKLPPPYANPDHAAGAKGQPVRFDPFGNDQATGTTFDPSTVMLRDSKGGWTRRLVVPGEGTWSVDAATGEVVFAPEPGFTGTATPVSYRAATRSGRLIRSTLHPTIVGPEAKLRITTTPSETQLRTQGSTTVRLRACNAGRATAVDAVVELPIPSGLALAGFRQSADGRTTLRGGVATWRVGSLAPGACVTRLVTVIAVRGGTSRLVGAVRAVNAAPASDPATIRASAGTVVVPGVTG